jgi:4,5-dihydroxyphthalate decarboxylase
MHIVAMHQDLVAQHPALPQALMGMFHQAHEINLDYYTDPNWSRLPWIRYLYEESEAAFGNPWVNGFKRNRANLEQFIRYSHDQGLIRERYAPERLFVPSTLDT